MTLARFDEVSVEFEHGSVLRDIDLSIERNEFLSIVGPNGGGKSTMIRLLIGAVKATSGSVYRLRGLRLGYVPQKLTINPNMPMTARQFMTMGSGCSTREFSDVLEMTGVAEFQERQLLLLSGGQFQRAMIARALLERPDMLVLDEATQGIDPAGAASFYHLVEIIRRERKIAIWMVSHELNAVARYSDRVVCVDQTVCCQGKPGKVLAAPETKLCLARSNLEHLQCTLLNMGSFAS